MALVERLMRTDPDESRYIAVHIFFAALHEIASGNATLNQLKSYWNTTTADNTELDTIAAAAPSGDGARAMYINRLHSVFILAEEGVPGYDTPANVRTKLGI